jgi:sugar lactone lactonase YvrE
VALHTLATGRYLEAPRWREGRLWLVDSLARTVSRIDAEGRSELVCRLPDVPAGLGFLPTGEVVVTAMFQRALFAHRAGEVERHADLSGVAAGTIDDMIVDGMGRCFVGDLGFDLCQGVPTGATGGLLRVMPGGVAAAATSGLRFPNGIAVSADGRRLVVAESNGDCLAEFAVDADGGLTLRRRFACIGEPDGLCLDAEGGAWVAAFKEDAIVRVDGDGRVTERIALPGRGVACALGGDDRRTLFCISAETTHEDLACGRSTSRLHAVRVAVPGSGFP